MIQDLNWGLFKVTPQEGKKPLKQPMDLHSGSIITKDEVFVHSLDDAKAKLNGGSTILGYLPREGSRFVGIDLDACLDGEDLVGWADDVLGDTAVPDAVTPSGTGLRMMQPRAPGDEATGGAGERNDVGFFTTDTKAFTVPLDLAEKLDQIKRDDKLVARVLHRRGPLLNVTPELAAKNKAEFYGKWGGHWLNRLSEDQQREAVVEMLAALPREFVNDRHEWTNISMGLSQLEGMVRWDVETAWDDWSRKSNVYDQQGNQQQWRSYEDGKGLTIFTVLHHAKESGFKPKPWMKLAEAADHARRAEGMEALMDKLRKKTDDKAVDKPTGALVNGADLMAWDPGELDWVVEQMIPPGLTILAGAMKVGKSFLLLQIMEAIAGGHNFFDKPTRKGKVLYYAVEDGATRIRRRLGNLPLDLDMRHITFAFEPSVSPDELVTRIAEDVITLEDDVALIIIDTFKMASGKRAEGTQNAYEADVEMLTPFKMLSSSGDLAILATFHERKPKPGSGGDADPFNAISGSAGILATADGYLRITRDREGRNAQLFVGGRDVEENQNILMQQKVDGGGKWSKPEERVLASMETAMDMRKGARRDILNLLIEAEGGLTRDQIRKECGQYSVGNIRGSVKRLKDDGEVTEDENEVLTIAVTP